MTNQTINLACTAGSRPTKNQIWPIVKAMADSGALDDVRDGWKLYAHFMPAVPKVPKTDFQWVASAAGRRDVRYYLNYVYCDGKRIIGTDGARLHIADNADGLAPGYYCPKTANKVDVDAQYPDVDRVIPKTNAGEQFTVSRDPLDTQAIDGGKTPVWCLREVKTPSTDKFGIEMGFKMVGQWTRREYIEAALAGHDEALAVSADAMSAIRMDMPDGRMAIVMPVRL